MQTDGGLLGVRSKELVQRRQRSGCRTSKRMRLEGETRKDNDDERVDPGGWMVRKSAHSLSKEVGIGSRSHCLF